MGWAAATTGVWVAVDLARWCGQRRGRTVEEAVVSLTLLEHSTADRGRLGMFEALPKSVR
jgi:hypothetical protein